jgi:hypothetical protein
MQAALATAVKEDHRDCSGNDRESHTFPPNLVNAYIAVVNAK